MNQSERMFSAARERLRGMDPAAIAEAAAVRLTERSIEIDSLGETVRLSLPEYRFEHEPEMWRGLTLLQYLSTADGTPLSGRWIPLKDMPGGLSRGYGFDKDIALMFSRTHADAAGIREACEQLGGTAVSGTADVDAVLRCAPRFPIRISFWEGDEEFPPSGKVLVDANAAHYLTLEAAGGACADAVQELLKRNS